MTIDELTDGTVKEFQSLEAEVRQLRELPRVEVNPKTSLHVDEHLQQELSQCRRELAEARARAEMAEHEIEVRRKELQLLLEVATIVPAEVVGGPSVAAPPAVTEEINAQIEQLEGRLQGLKKVLAEKEKARVTQENRLDALRVELSEYE